jgi:hypothetical protein
MRLLERALERDPRSRTHASNDFNRTVARFRATAAHQLAMARACTGSKRFSDLGRELMNFPTRAQIAEGDRTPTLVGPAQREKAVDRSRDSRANAR